MKTKLMYVTIGEIIRDNDLDEKEMEYVRTELNDLIERMELCASDLSDEEILNLYIVAPVIGSIEDEYGVSKRIIDWEYIDSHRQELEDYKDGIGGRWTDFNKGCMKFHDVFKK